MISFQPDYVIPALRNEISFKIREEDGEKFVMLSDPENFATQPAVLPINMVPFLQLINGDYTFSAIQEIISSEVKEEKEFIIRVFSELVVQLDYMGYLDSPRFNLIKYEIEEYIKSDIRKPVCAGTSYPADREPFITAMESILNYSSKVKPHKSVKAILAPHIDFRTGNSAINSYSAAYNAISRTKADLFVIFGTSHYASSDLFMLTGKHFNTPAGVVESDRNLLNKIRNLLSFNLKFDDMAHRQEHSIELQTVLLNRAFTDRDFTILPILTSSFLYEEESISPNSNFARIDEFLHVLKKVIDESGRHAIYIASADFAHIGRKFGDDFSAEGELDRLRKDDEKLLTHLLNLDADGFLGEITNCADKNRICGLSPVYSLLKVMEYEKAEFLSYGQWYERETESAVSFASMAFS